MIRRVRCASCEKLVPADGELVVKVMVTSGSDRPIIGHIERSTRTVTASPAYCCTNCVAAFVSSKLGG